MLSSNNIDFLWFNKLELVIDMNQCELFPALNFIMLDENYVPRPI